ncbi:SH3 domain-containing protein [Chryseobacterium arthrosphaerae]|uniref:SH3 domain-containing protein n=1 Tax=Chryseobacterium arthrosphaerae TaxID=651561 RepID=UPI001BAFB025|nr:SH3 domain-containing protein [Chryseobacterium arthrosphaerae]QUY53958.1 SH3 domain-containing protein [Chryseobacterium arthrosphaerae]
MKTKKIFLAAAILSIQLSFAQFAKIVDKDGYVNLRENPDAKSKITGKISSDEIVYASEPDAANKNWVNVYYNDKTAGYINTSKVKLLDSYETLLPVTTDENKAVFRSGNIKVDIISEKFNYKENKKFFSSSSYGGQKIEDQYKGKLIWGTDGTIPRTHYKSITVQIRDKKIQIPTKEIENLFNVSNQFTACYYDRKSDTLYITMLNSDGAGSYVALFKIVKGVYKERIVKQPF